MTLVLKVDCRACNRECGDYKHLLDETVIDDESTTFAALLKYCTTLNCFAEYYENGVPEHICKSCVDHLLQFYLFKKMVLKNERAYQERLDTLEKTKELVVSVKEEIDFECKDETMEMEEFISIKEEEIVKSNNVNECENKECIEIYENNNEAGSKNWEYNLNAITNNVDPKEVKTYNSKDNEDQDKICAREQLEELSKRKKEKRKTLSKADLTCQYCGKVFKQRYILRDHSYIHTGEKPHVCKICGKKFRTKGHYDVHMLAHNKRRYKCSKCGQAFRTFFGLRVHEREHSNFEPFACKLCDKRFYTADLLKRHFRIHTKERPFICGTCGKSYREKRILKTHMITHEDEIWYQCKVCGKEIKKLTRYKEHMLLHTIDSPYKCDVCERSFPTSGNLAKHKHWHSAKLSYQCTKCDKAFRYKTSLKQHMLLHDPK